MGTGLIRLLLCFGSPRGFAVALGLRERRRGSFSA